MPSIHDRFVRYEPACGILRRLFERYPVVLGIRTKLILGTADGDIGTRIMRRRVPRFGSDIMYEGMSSQFKSVLQGPIPFPVEAARASTDRQSRFSTASWDSGAIEDDRRMNVLARRLRCFVSYDNDSDGPCAA